MSVVLAPRDLYDKQRECNCCPWRVCVTQGYQPHASFNQCSMIWIPAKTLKIWEIDTQRLKEIFIAAHWQREPCRGCLKACDTHRGFYRERSVKK